MSCLGGGQSLGELRSGRGTDCQAPRWMHSSKLSELGCSNREGQRPEVTGGGLGPMQITSTKWPSLIENESPGWATPIQAGHGNGCSA